MGRQLPLVRVTTGGDRRPPGRDATRAAASDAGGMDSAYEGHSIQVRPARDADSRDLTAQVYDRDGRAVGAGVAVATWAQVELLEERYHVRTETTQVEESARRILDQNSGTTTA